MTLKVGFEYTKECSIRYTNRLLGVITFNWDDTLARCGIIPSLRGIARLKRREAG